MATNLLDDPSVRRHRHQLPRHHRAPGARDARSASSCSGWRCCRASRAPSASARTCAASSRWWCAARRRAAGGFLLHLPLRHGREPAHRELRRRAQPSRWRPRLGMTEDTLVPIDENGLSRCVHGHLVYEPDIARFAVSVSATARERRPALAGHRAAAGGEPGVRRAGLRAARAPTPSAAANASSCARPASTSRWPRTRRSCTARCSAPTTTCARPSSRSCSRSACARSARWRAASRTTSTTRSRRWRCTPRRCSSASRTSRPRARSQLEIIQRAVDDVAQTVARMGEFYRQREPQLSLLPVDLNKLVQQVVDLTRARWSDMAQQRGAAIDMRTRARRATCRRSRRSRARSATR